jgi:putative heme iron utilization protein
MTEPRQKLDLTVRRLIRRARSGALATALAGEDARAGRPDRGASSDARGDSPARPYASLVTVAWGTDASPIFLFSTLSDHTRNLARDPRAALLIEHASRRANPQTGPRVTLIGRVAPCAGGEDEASARRRFLARHPEAARYAGFGDFRFYRMAVDSAHYVGGFARAVWIEGPKFALPPESVAAVAACEAGVLAHMNDDHKNTVDRYARRLLGRRGKGWALAGLDPDGIDLRKDAHFARLDFAEPVATVGEVRDTLMALAGRGRIRNAPKRRKK